MNMSESVPPIQPVTPSTETTRGWEVMCHLSSLVGLLGVPFGNILAPLVVWLLKRHDSLGVDAHGKESLNFNISWSIYWLVAGAVVGILCIVIIGLALVPVLIVGGIVGWISMVILTIIASVKASNGQIYRYPLTIRFLK
jgi:uncharacterized protein